MKVAIRAVLLASVLALTIAAPAFADAPEWTHVSSQDCFTIPETGFTYCSYTETDTRTKEKKSGETSVHMDQWFMTTTTDPSGALVSTLELNATEKNTVLVADGAPIFLDQNVRRSDELTEGGVTTCTRYRLVVKHGEERVNEVTTTPGPC